MLSASLQISFSTEKWAWPTRDRGLFVCLFVIRLLHYSLETLVYKTAVTEKPVIFNTI